MIRKVVICEENELMTGIEQVNTIPAIPPSIPKSHPLPRSFNFRSPAKTL